MNASSPIVALSGLSKSFGAVRANRNISLRFYPGTIKALLGENGAGKSTLMSMLAGRFRPDSGTIVVDGEARRFSSPKDAFRSGIGMVYQHFMLVDSMTVAENVLLGQEGGFLLSPRAMRDTVAALAQRYGMEVDPAARVGTLSMGERQRVEILKLLHRNCRLLIFDEPTAVLTPGESERLFEALRRMAGLGKSVVFISHKLREVLSVADEVAVLRRGEIVDEFPAAHAPDEHVLAARMLGPGFAFDFERGPELPLGEEVLAVNNLSGGGLEDISFTLRKGEVLAVAGVAGNGQKELAEALSGLSRPERGSVRVLGKDWRQYFPRTPQRGGLAYIPEDRQGLATCLSLSLVDNVLLTARALFTRGPLLSGGDARVAAEQLIAEYDIRPGDPGAPARALSGGNLQKLVIGRELLREPSLIVAENPTQGLDVAAARDVWVRLSGARARAGILLITGDVSEALQLADRIAVMYRGRFIDCFARTDAAKVEAIGLMMAGIAPTS